MDPSSPLHRARRTPAPPAPPAPSLASLTQTAQHEFLMHAILGFAASELARTDGGGALVAAALAHRVRAITAIRRRLADASRAELAHDEANALVATCFALTFQSVSLEDGLAEYMTFVRGILVVGALMVARGIAPVFDGLFDDRHHQLVAPLMRQLPLIRADWAQAAAQAVAGLRPLCAGPVETAYP